MAKKKIVYFVLVAVATLFIAFIIDSAYFMKGRVQEHVWQSRGGKDYNIVEKDLIAYKQDFEIKGDTILFTTGQNS